MNNEEIILGLDISTKCIGVCLYYFHPSKGSKILKITHFLPKVSSKISGIEKLFIKAKIFEDEFLSNIKDINITKVIIEEPLMKSNNVNTVDVLIKFNGIISNSIYKILGIVPDYISSYDARRYAFPELISIRRFNKNGEKLPYEKLINLIRKNDIVLFGDYPYDCDKKLILWNKISEQYPYIEWVYGKNGELKKENEWLHQRENQIEILIKKNDDMIRSYNESLAKKKENYFIYSWWCSTFNFNSIYHKPNY